MNQLAQLESSYDYIAQLEASVERLELERISLHDRVNALLIENADLQDELEGYDERNEDLLASLSELQAEVRSLENEREEWLMEEY
jgi:hypothetical protein